MTYIKPVSTENINNGVASFKTSAPVNKQGVSLGDTNTVSGSGALVDRQDTPRFYSGDTDN